MLTKAEDLADKNWPEILAAAGVDGSFFSGRQGPCPFCGGRDRYRFQNRNGGRYVCNQCTESKWKGGFDFLMRHMGYLSFRQAADHVREYFGVKPGCDVLRIAHRPMRQVETPEMAHEKYARAIARMLSVWRDSKPVQSGDPVDLYLRGRVPRLGVMPTEIRFHRALPYWDAPSSLDGKPTLRGTYPAMLVLGLDAQGEVVQLHKTYLTTQGSKAEVPYPKKTDVGVGSNSFALRLGWPDGDSLGVCEGIETALAAGVLRPGIPVWPCHSSSVLANFEVPESLRGQVKRVIIYADADEMKNGKKAGQESAALLADRLRRVGIRSLIVRPAKIGTDMVQVAGGH